MIYRCNNCKALISFKDTNPKYRCIDNCPICNSINLKLIKGNIKIISDKKGVK